MFYDGVIPFFSWLGKNEFPFSRVNFLFESNPVLYCILKRSPILIEDKLCVEFRVSIFHPWIIFQGKNRFVHVLCCIVMCPKLPVKSINIE